MCEELQRYQQALKQTQDENRELKKQLSEAHSHIKFLESDRNPKAIPYEIQDRTEDDEIQVMIDQGHFVYVQTRD